MTPITHEKRKRKAKENNIYRINSFLYSVRRKIKLKKKKK